METVIAFVMGACVGSFLNVCIARLPLAQSVVTPGSHCMACGKPVRWFDNIPILSYFILGGKCRDCKAAYSIRYAFVELLTALTFVLFYRSFGVTPFGAIYLTLTLALITQTFIDFDHQIIPDEITLPGIILGFVFSGIFPGLHGQTVWHQGLLQSLFGILAGGGFLYASAMLAEFFLKKEAMGGGDIKLLAMIGALIGWLGAFWVIFAASLIGSVVGIYLRITKGQQLIPFGPYIGAGAVLYLFYGQKVIGWYIGRLGF